MRILFNWLRIAIFALFITAPLLALAVIGAVDPYGQRPQLPFPKLNSLLQTHSASFDDFGRALLDRSAVTKWAIALKNSAGYLGIPNSSVRFIDTAGVVSGRGDWLFHRSTLPNGECHSAVRVAAALSHIDVMTEMARVAGLDFIFSLSPDKSSVYPEYLHPLARRYWSCKQENTALLRRLMPVEAPQMIDHRAALLEAKSFSDSPELFYHTDTHWTAFSAALALRQLATASFGPPSVPIPFPQLSGESYGIETDMGNLMLLLPVEEQAEAIDRTVELNLPSLFSDVSSKQTTVLHDSFYLHVNFL